MPLSDVKTRIRAPAWRARSERTAARFADGKARSARLSRNAARARRPSSVLAAVFAKSSQVAPGGSRTSSRTPEPKWCASSTITSSNRFPIRSICRQPLSNVATVIASTRRSPSPRHPTGPPNAEEISRTHCARSTRVGTRARAGRRARAIAAIASRVFPLPVGRTTTPRRRASCQAQWAESWYWRRDGSAHGPTSFAARTTSSEKRTPRRASSSRMAWWCRAGARSACTRGSQSIPGRSETSTPARVSRSRIVPRSKRRRTALTRASIAPPRRRTSLPRRAWWPRPCVSCTGNLS